MVVPVFLQLERDGNDDGSEQKQARGGINLGSDASGSWGCGPPYGREWFQLKWAGHRCIRILGCGALYGREWFQLKWAGQGRSSEQNITVKELLPIVIASHLGSNVGRQNSRSSVCQHGSSGHSKLWYKQGARGDASETLHGISGGQAHIPCFHQPH